MLLDRMLPDCLTTLPRATLAPAALALACSLGAAHAADGSFQVAQNSRQIPGGYVGGATSGMGDIALRVDRSETQMRQLTGQIEELTYQVRQLQEQLKRMQEDNEFRFQELEAARGKKRSDLAPAAPAPSSDEMRGFTDIAAAPPPAAGEPVDSGPVDAGSVDLGPIGAPIDGTPGAAPGSAAVVGTPPATLGTLAGEPASGFDPNAGPLDLTAMTTGAVGLPAAGAPGSPSGSTGLPGITTGEPYPATASDAPPAAAAGAQMAALPAASNAREIYDAAYNHVLRGEYAEAEAGFHHFLEAHPDDALTADAEYWLGESLYARSDYRSAAKAFLKGYTEHPDSRKAPDALFKLGLSLSGMGERVAACASFKELLQRYPAASTPLKDRVRNEQKTAKC